MDVLSADQQFSVADHVVAEPLTVDTTRLPPGLVVVAVRGEVTESFITLMERALRNPPETVLIDLTRVTFFCASGIAALMDVRRHCANIAVSMRLVAPHPVRRPLELVGLGGLFTVSDNEQDAVVEVLDRSDHDGSHERALFMRCQ